MVAWVRAGKIVQECGVAIAVQPVFLIRKQQIQFGGRKTECLHRPCDTTEADLKQRREIAPGGTVVYMDLAVVQAAVNGRVLILEGLEKAERNVLPIINNLLENREMALEDGRFLVASRRYDALKATRPAAEIQSLVRVHPGFRVIAISVPVPPFSGNPLDPPLRSRFQARIVRSSSIQTLAGAIRRSVRDAGKLTQVTQLLGLVAAVREVASSASSTAGAEARDCLLYTSPSPRDS